MNDLRTLFPEEQDAKTGEKRNFPRVCVYFLQIDLAHSHVSPNARSRPHMKTLILWIGWCLLFVLCWPAAILAVVLFPFVWLLSLPLRLIGIALGAVFAFLRAVLFLPARLLGAVRW
jgi:hypothetical protein